MRRLCNLLLLAGLVLGSAFSLLAAEYTLSNGNVLKGEIASFNPDGLVVRLDIGGFSERTHWIQFTQETLKDLQKDKRLTEFVDPFIELPPEEVAKQKEIPITEAPKVDRVTEKTGMFGAFISPVGLTILAALFLANLYAGYEIAIFRQRPVAVVCAVSAVAPVIGPVIFLSMPPANAPASAAPVEAESEASAPAVNPLANPGGVGMPSGGGLSIKEQAAHGATGGATEVKIFKRGEFTFNRRFFETQFAGFFRVVPSEAEKNLVLVVKAGRNEYVCKRVTRISSSDVHLQPISGGEVSVAFPEIVEVQVRNKDAK